MLENGFWISSRVCNETDDCLFSLLNVRGHCTKMPRGAAISTEFVAHCAVMVRNVM